MVQVETSKSSTIRDLLGLSGWIDVVGSANDKGCAEEGRGTVAMLKRVVGAGLKPDLRASTPFVQVADGLRRMIRERAILASGGIHELDF